MPTPLPNLLRQHIQEALVLFLLWDAPGLQGHWDQVDSRRWSSPNGAIIGFSSIMSYSNALVAQGVFGPQCSLWKGGRMQNGGPILDHCKPYLPCYRGWWSPLLRAPRRSSLPIMWQECRTLTGPLLPAASSCPSSECDYRHCSFQILKGPSVF